MPRNGSGIFSLPAGSTVTNGDVSDATDVNTPLADIEADMNTARPVVAGGTGATSASGARTNLAVPGLATNNTFSGDNTFSGANTIPNLNVLAQGVISGGAVGQIAVDIPSDFGGVEVFVQNFAPVTNAAQLAAQIGTGTVASPTWITADYRMQAITNTTPSTLAGSNPTGLSSWLLTSPIYKTVKFPNVSRYVIWGFNQTGFATIDGTTWGVPDPGTARVQAVQSGAHDNSVTPTIMRLLATSGNIEDAAYLIRGIKKAV